MNRPNLGPGTAQGLSQAEHHGDKDWESIGVNAIGMLAFYNLRYDVAALCFNAVGDYRLSVRPPVPVPVIPPSACHTPLERKLCCALIA